MKVLGIETSCDECSLALVEDRRVINMSTKTQTETHNDYHGIVPELASRRHIELINSVCREALAGTSPRNLDGIAVTNRPGLSGSLAVGLNFAKALSYACDIPFVAVNHIMAHAYAIQLDKRIAFPYLVYIVSGGHTLLGEYRNFDTLLKIGETVDDACGEVFDKIADYLGLGYPGAAALDALARKGNARAYAFPRSKIKQKPYDCSYSGLKTAVIHQRTQFATSRLSAEQEDIKDIAASFEKTAIDMLFERVAHLRNAGNNQKLIFCGGVASNSYLRQLVKKNKNTYIPSPEYCVDNAAMIAALGIEYLKRGRHSDYTVDVSSREILQSIDTC